MVWIVVAAAVPATGAAGCDMHPAMLAAASRRIKNEKNLQVFAVPVTLFLFHRITVLVSP